MQVKTRFPCCYVQLLSFECCLFSDPFLIIILLGVHRQLGPNVTLVQSAKLDSWKMDKIEILAAVGNKIANNYWEHSLPSYYRRPDITTSMEDVRRMVNDKYIKRLYANKDARNPVEEFVEARKNSQMTAGAFRQLKLEQMYIFMT